MMETEMKETHEEQAELSNEKQPYEAPRLKKQGTIRDLTLGGTYPYTTDNGDAYRIGS